MVTTRFAPSPTGYLHVGNIRTALFNYLITRKATGQFILRLDDTDPVRSRQEYIDAIYEDLEWLGLTWDRVEQQSQRLERYRQVTQHLIEEGSLYECFETPQELEIKRKVQLKMGKPPVYDREALTLSDKEKSCKRETAKGYWRFKLDGHRIDWTDGIQGDVSIDSASVSDPVLIRADGQYLYTFASVVDDHDMQISHVVRGADHITNTAVQIQIFGQLGSMIPKFSHHSLLLDREGEPLSKRIGGLAIRELRQAGLEALPILSQLAFAGSSQAIAVKFSQDEIIDAFELKSFNRNPTRYDDQILWVLNAEFFREVPYSTVESRIVDLGIPPNEGQRLWDCVKGNITQLCDVLDWWQVFALGAKPVIRDGDRDFVIWALSLLPDLPFHEDTWVNWTKNISAQSDRRGRKLFMPLRLALTGKEMGPDMSQIMPLIKSLPKIT